MNRSRTWLDKPRAPMKRAPIGLRRLEEYESERAFQDKVVQLAELLGWFTWHINLPQRSKAGFPDLLCVRERVVWVELKVYRRGGIGKLSPEQRQFHETLRGAGQEVYVFYNDSDDWETMQRVFAKVSL